MKQSQIGIIAVLILASLAGGAKAAQLEADMRAVTDHGPGALIGSIAISDSPGGAVFKPDLKGLPPGERHFHIHENGSCEPTTVDGKIVPAGAAGGHWNPDHMDMSHMDVKGMDMKAGAPMGDLPSLSVSANGMAAIAVTAPRIKNVALIAGKALMIHNDAGVPIACGVIR